MQQRIKMTVKSIPLFALLDSLDDFLDTTLDILGLGS
jgi:hypothetical protein